jgi:hypothetical protein
MRWLRRLKRLSKRAKILVVGAGLILVALIAVAASSGGSTPESALHKEMSRVRAGACRSEVFNTAHCGEEMQKVCETSVGSGSGEPAERHISCELASEVRTQVKKNEEAQTPAHTPEEEEGHNKGLEIHRRYEEEEAEGQKKVEEDETRGGEHSIRRVEEKVCYESGKTSEECKGPLKETPQEERSEAENKARQQQGQEESTGKPAVVE